MTVPDESDDIVKDHFQLRHRVEVMVLQDHPTVRHATGVELQFTGLPDHDADKPFSALEPSGGAVLAEPGTDGLQRDLHVQVGPAVPPRTDARGQLAQVKGHGGKGATKRTLMPPCVLALAVIGSAEKRDGKMGGWWRS